MNEESGNIEYHYGFYAVLHLLCSAAHADFTFLQEYELGDKPLRIDMLIINNSGQNDFNDEKIMKFFRGHNVIEYKSPDDGLDIHDFFKVQGYAGIYQDLKKIDIDKITVSIFRHRKPRKMFDNLVNKGFDITESYPGIYYVTGRITFPTQVIVTSRLPAGSYEALKILTGGAKEEDVIKFMQAAQEHYNKDDVSAILRVSMALNKNLYKTLKEASPMKDVFREIFHDELMEKEAALAASRAEGVALGISIGETRGISIGETRGIYIGEARGRNEERKALTDKLIDAGWNPLEAARFTGLSI